MSNDKRNHSWEIDTHTQPKLSSHQYAHKQCLQSDQKCNLLTFLLFKCALVVFPFPTLCKLLDALLIADLSWSSVTTSCLQVRNWLVEKHHRLCIFFLKWCLYIYRWRTTIYNIGKSFLFSKCIKYY